MAPFEKKNRSKVACNRCRDSKIRCVNFGVKESCVRCMKLQVDCSYSPTLVQQRLRESKNTTTKTSKTFNHKKKHGQILWKINELHEEIKFPPKDIVLSLVHIFFENQYNGIFPFIHKPTFLEFLNSERFNPTTYLEDYNAIVLNDNSLSRSFFPDPILLAAILALCCRFHSLLAPFNQEQLQFEDDHKLESLSRTLGMLPLEASKYYGEQARQLLKDVFDQPTIQRIQALVLLSSHEWGEGNSARSFVYIGIAARMALILGLGNEESAVKNNSLHDRETAINKEIRHRTIWSIYMMDRCNSSGRNRTPAMKVSDIRVGLPSDEKDFLFGTSGKCYKYKDILRHIKDGRKPFIQLVPLSNFTIIVFELWSKIAYWVGEIDGKQNGAKGLNSDKSFVQLKDELKEVHDMLPSHLLLNELNLQMHILHSNGAHFGYFHALLLLCEIFMLRETFFRGQTSILLGQWKQSAIKMLGLLQSLTTLVSTLKQNKMMVLAPFTAFEVYTASITGLFFYAYPTDIMKRYFLSENKQNGDDLSAEIVSMKNSFKTVAHENMDMLVEWALSWELARRWYSSINKLGQVFENCFSDGKFVLENESVRHEIQDYGDGNVREIHTTVLTRRVSILNLLSSNSETESLPKDVTYTEMTPNKDDTFEDYYINLIPSPMLDFFNNTGSPGFTQRFDSDWGFNKDA